MELVKVEQSVGKEKRREGKWENEDTLRESQICVCKSWNMRGGPPEVSAACSSLQGWIHGCAVPELALMLVMLHRAEEAFKTSLLWLAGSWSRRRQWEVSKSKGIEETVHAPPETTLALFNRF